MADNDSNLFGGSVDRSKLEEMKAAAGDDPGRLAQVAEVQAQVDAVAESDAAAEQARQEALGQKVDLESESGQPEESQPEPVQPAESVDEDRDALRAELDQLGVEYDGRWGVDRLRQERDAAREG